jgi:hypothetical protein
MLRIWNAVHMQLNASWLNQAGLDLNNWGNEGRGAMWPLNQSSEVYQGSNGNTNTKEWHTSKELLLGREQY